MLSRVYKNHNKITAVGIHDGLNFTKQFPNIKYIKINPIGGEGVRLPFGENTFDIVYSNAVIEHVGSVQNQKRFIDELIRVGRKICILAPNKYFPIEHHTGIPFIHWLPTAIYKSLLNNTRYKYWTSEKNLIFCSRSNFVKLLPINSNIKVEIMYSGLGFGLFRSNILLYVKKY